MYSGESWNLTMTEKQEMITLGMDCAQANQTERTFSWDRLINRQTYQLCSNTSEENTECKILQDGVFKA